MPNFGASREDTDLEGEEQESYFMASLVSDMNAPVASWEPLLTDGKLLCVRHGQPDS